MKTIYDTFGELVSKRKWYARLGLDRKSADYIKKKYKSGKIKYETMHDILIASGYKIVQQELWDKA